MQPASAKKDMLPSLEFDDSPFEPADNGLIISTPAPELDNSMPVPPEPVFDDVSAAPSQRNFGDALLVPSASDDDDGDDEMSDEFWDK